MLTAVLTIQQLQTELAMQREVTERTAAERDAAQQAGMRAFICWRLPVLACTVALIRVVCTARLRVAVVDVV